MSSNVILSPCLLDVAKNIGFSVFGSVFSIVRSLLDIGISRGKLPFSGWFIATVLLLVSMSIHVTAIASPMRVAVSFRNCRSGARVRPDADIKLSISCSVGMK